MSADDKLQAENASENAPKLDQAERIAGLERENADLKDRLLRALAEMENLRRRTEREIQDTRAFSITKFASDMIGTADNLRRAIESAPKAEEGDEGEAITKAVAPLLEGVSLTERDLLKALEKHGVKRREPVGERFDPHRDQAMFEIPDETVPNGTVMQVMQVGYTIGERILRPAMVGVSKGGPVRPASDPEAEKAGDAPQTDPARPGGAQEPSRPKFDKRA